MAARSEFIAVGDRVEVVVSRFNQLRHEESYKAGERGVVLKASPNSTVVQVRLEGDYYRVQTVKPLVTKPVAHRIVQASLLHLKLLTPEAATGQACSVWVYWLPAYALCLGAGQAPEDPEDSEEGQVCLAVDLDGPPPGAKPVQGELRCRGDVCGKLMLDGRSLTPVPLRMQLLPGLTCDVRTNAGFVFSPAPADAGQASLEGEELRRLWREKPLVVGRLRALPGQLQVRTSCCGRGYAGSRAMVNGRPATPVGDRDGLFEFPPSWVTEAQSSRILMLHMNSVPACLLPGGDAQCVAKCSEVSVPGAPHAELEVSCRLWLYWVPPRDEEEEGEDDDGGRGLLWLTVDASQLSPEAVPVKGRLNCPGAEQRFLELDGESLGPFSLKPRAARPTAGSDAPRCLLSGLQFDMSAPSGYRFEARSPSPLAERVQELGGCELQRLALCPVVVGYFRLIERPPLMLQVCSACCGRPFGGACIVEKGRDPRLTNANGPMEFRRKRNGGTLSFKVDLVPQCLLPGGSRECSFSYGPFEPASVGFEMACKVFVYWLPPPPEEEESPDGDEVEGMIFVATAHDHVPAEARPVKGALLCPLAEGGQVALDGTSTGPFELRRLWTQENAPCLLSQLSLQAAAPEGYTYRALPSPLEERYRELGGCELERLAQCPVALGAFRLIPRPPLMVQLRTTCCARGILNSCCSADGQAAQCLDQKGCVQVRRRRNGGVAKLVLDSDPAGLLPGGKQHHWVDYRPFEPSGVALDILCHIWVYWLPPEPDDEFAEGLLCAAARADHIPDEAKPLSGNLEVLGAGDNNTPLADFMGPFMLRSPQVKAGAVDQGERKCIASRLMITPRCPEGYTYVARSPSPLAERCAELGGCEFERMLNCPVVLGSFKQIPRPRLHLQMRTCCCAGRWEAASVAINGAPPRAFDMAGCLELKRERWGGRLDVRVDGVPSCLLPGGLREHKLDYDAFEPLSHLLEITCQLFAYWVPPDADDESEDAMGMVFLAIDREHIPDEALPVEGMLECPLAVKKKVFLDGSSMGPFEMRASPGVDSAAPCLLAELTMEVKPPEGYTYNARQPTPMAQRWREFAGCEMQRMTEVPVAMGSLTRAGPLEN